MPEFPDVMVSHEVLLLAADQVQVPDEGVTVKLPVPLEEEKDLLVEERV